MHIERYVRSLEQEFERRICHEVAGRHESKKPNAVLRWECRRLPIEQPELERLGLHGHAAIAIAQQLQHRGEIHQCAGIVRIGSDAFDQFTTYRHQVGAGKSRGGQRREADRNRRLIGAGNV